MPWVRIDDQFPQHPKVARVGPLGMVMQVAGLCYCNRNLTDGFIPWAVAQTLLSWEFLGDTTEQGAKRWHISVGCGMHGEDVTADFVLGLLISAGIWEEVDGGYHIHDYADYQPSREDVLRERAQGAERVRNYKARHANAVSNAVSNGRANAVSNAEVTGAPNPVPSTQYPVPSTPVPLPSPDAETAVSSPAQRKSRKRAKTEVVPLGDDFEARMLRKFPILGAALIHDQIELAMSHQARLKHSNMELYCQNWLRREAERLIGGNNGTDRRHNEGDYPSPAHIPGSEHTIPDSEYPAWVPLPSRVGL